MTATPLTDALADAIADDIYPACDFCGEPIDYCLGGHQNDPAWQRMLDGDDLFIPDTDADIDYAHRDDTRSSDVYVPVA